MPVSKASMDSRDRILLLAHVLRRPKEYLLAHPEHKLTAGQKNRFLKLMHRRARHEPLAYIVGKKEFYGLNLKVNRHVLIPRPDTEILVDAVLDQLRVTSYELRVTIIDIGTGSGAIAIALAKSLQSTDYRLQLFATDTSEAALGVARVNARRHGVKIKFFKTNLLMSSRGHQAVAIPSIKRLLRRPDFVRTPRNDLLVITANLPYLTTKQWRKTQPEIKNYEPRTALDGGKDGLKYYRQLLNELRIMNYELRITLFIEHDPAQTSDLKRLVHQYFPTSGVEIKKDLAGLNRVMIIS